MKRTHSVQKKDDQSAQVLCSNDQQTQQHQRITLQPRITCTSPPALPCWRIYRIAVEMTCQEVTSHD